MTETSSPELDIVVQFLEKCLPFSELNSSELSHVASRVKISYAREGTLFKADQGPRQLMILRSGALDVLSESGSLIDRLGEGESINLNNLADDEPNVKARVIDDALMYQIDETTLLDLRKTHRRFDRFFHGQRARRLRRAARYSDGTPELLTTAKSLIHQQVVSVTADTSVADAAQRMVDNRVSSILVIENGELLGMLTDRDIRSRVVAKNLPLDTSVSSVMTTELVTLDETATVFEAILIMGERGVHHLPLLDSGDVLGVITISDLVRSRQRDPVFLIQTLSRKKTVSELAVLCKDLPSLVPKLVSQGAKAEQISRILCAISERVTRKLINLAEQQFGPPPLAYAWLGFGSQARYEIALGGDQDNALVIAGQPNDLENSYFEKLSNFVCDGLDACGYPFCRGGIMAKNPLWRLSLADWKETVSGWVRSPTDDAVMRVSIFFDIRCIAGDAELTAQLQQHMLQTASQNSIFLAALARNALCNRPPLGFFRRFVLERDGEHQDQLDLKHRGVIPVVDMARVHAIANQVESVNTSERLEALAKEKKMALKDARNIQDALTFIMQIRLEEQCRRLQNGEQPNNFINPEELGDMTRKQLRDAFSTINDGQESISLAFSAGTF